MPRSVAQQWLTYGMIALGLAGLIAACSPMENPIGPTSLNSRYTDEQPALSGNGRFLAFVSNRQGTRRILLYDIQKRQNIYLPGLNRLGAIAESPSLSYTARYIVYIIDDRGRPLLALYDRVTQQSQALTRFYQGAVRHPSISPDGRYILFESGRRGQWDIEVIDRGPNIEFDRPGGAGEQGSRGAMVQGSKGESKN